jgi:hypothetical protein
MYMCLSVAYWLTQSLLTDLSLNISIYDLDDSTTQPIARLYRNVPRLAAGRLITNYFIALTSSVCLGLPSHIIVYHYHSQQLSVPKEFIHLLTSSCRFIVPSTILTHNLDSDSDYTLASSPESLYPFTPESTSPTSSVTSLST